MIAIITLLIIAIGIAGIASYNLFSVTQSQQLLVQSQQNLSSLQLWRNVLISKARAVGNNNEIVLPYGEDKTSYHTVPSWVYFNTKNPWNKDFIYCPYTSFSNTAGNNATIKLTGTSNYAVQTYNGYATTFNNVARNYVVASTPNPISSNIMAYIISPIPSASTAIPSCDKVVYDSSISAYKVENGLVEVITKGDLETFLSLANASGSQAGNAAFYSNSIEGDNSTKNNTLAYNLGYIVAQDISKAYLYLPAGTHNIEAIALNNLRTRDNDNSKILVIEGASQGSTIIDTKLAKAALNFNDYKVTFKNLTLSNKVLNNFTDSNLSTENVQLANLNLNNSSFRVQGTTSVIGSSNPTTLTKQALSAFNSSIMVNDTQTLNVYEPATGNSNDNAITLEKSELNVGGTLNIYKNITNSPTILSYRSDISIGSNYSALASVINIEKNTISAYRSDIELDNLSSLSLSSNSAMALTGKSTYGVYLLGKMDVRNARVVTKEAGTNNSAIYMNSGSELSMNGDTSSYVGNPDATKRPTYSLYDAGGAVFIGGSGTQLYGKTNCYYGPIFTWSKGTSTANDLTSTTSSSGLGSLFGSGTEYKVFASKMNSSNWPCTKG